MQPEIIENPVAQPILELLSVYDESLPTVSFPDVSSDILKSLAADVTTKAQELADALAIAEEARVVLDASQNELLLRSTRALAYAKIFAEHDDAMSEKLAAISLGKSVRIQKKGEKTRSVMADGDENDDGKKEVKKSRVRKLTEEEGSQELPLE